MRFDQKIGCPLLICLLAWSGRGLSAQGERQPLLREGMMLQGVDGQVIGDPEVGRWDFVARSDGGDRRTAALAGVRIELLPSSALESLRIDMGQRCQADYRVWAKTTQYDAKTYLFVDHFLPLGTSLSPPVPATEPEPASTAGEGEDRVDALGIPKAIDRRRLAMRRVEQPSVPSIQAQKPNRLFLDRVGYLRESENEVSFIPDGRGLQVQRERFVLLPCRLLSRMQQRQSASLRPVHFSIAGLLTEYQGRDYLMLQRAVPVYDFGNFGR